MRCWRWEGNQKKKNSKELLDTSPSAVLYSTVADKTLFRPGGFMEGEEVDQLLDLC